MNWDPDSCSYGHKRPFDDAQPPNIPEEFRKFVQDAIQVSHEFLEQSMGVANAVEKLPSMSPDICLVNFYGTSGKLGLHQDKDETKASLDKGLPVVSFSIGETAEFLYGDVRDVDKASKIDLESGDNHTVSAKMKALSMPGLILAVYVYLPSNAPPTVF
ncbi:hypothetical protein PR202_ga13940 [Eleusine coracana subsp. coracana]|uniref:Alpha-ketoglutarate-dependent dioxygenase AlkB-like domain-containing protein n=1 Tax=Eleusine coracana subsp. coracana TaxID=191504 RepID=A0AAV5CG09_ELECO|nr:hypothetical protein PR202_ga13940 [Eleusine coracana subsp. coracana]